MSAAPWTVGEYDETGGYDCMTGGIRIGPALLDGREYGQENCSANNALPPLQMMADAFLIGAAHDLLAACNLALGVMSRRSAPKEHFEAQDALRAAIAKATAP